MGFFTNRRKKRALKKIATLLPPFLKKSYGKADGNTPGQINQAMAQTKCDDRYIQYAFAMFCTEAVFGEYHQGSDYHDLRLEVADNLFHGSDSFSAIDSGSVGGDFGGGDGGGD